jgi:fructokinase
MPDVICLGEILIDFISTESFVTVAQAPAFEKKPGGAPANVACGLSRLSIPASFVGKTGRDHFGEFLRETLAENKVNIEGLAVSDKCNTTLAFVSLAASGERSFTFYRNPGADTQLTPDDLPKELFKAASIFHFGK